MSSLDEGERRYLEEILSMGEGYVLDFNNATFDTFFKKHNINIHAPKYCSQGTSKAKKTRAFWVLESDALVSKVLAEMMKLYEALCRTQKKEVDKANLEECYKIISRLSGKKIQSAENNDEDTFLKTEFAIDIQSLPIEGAMMPIIKSRLEEAKKALSVGAYLSVILLCGSMLEGVLLGAAQKSPKDFNVAKSSPKDGSGKVREISDWKLNELIEVAYQVNLLKTDVRSHVHSLRDFRNYIHPYQQMQSGFTPDKHTAKISLQVLKAAFADLSGNR